MRKIALAFSLAAMLLLTACNKSPTQSQSQSGSSKPPVETSSPSSSSKAESSQQLSSVPSEIDNSKPTTEDEMFGNIDDITRVVIAFGEGPWGKRRDLTSDELDEFKILLKPIECTLAGNRHPKAGAVGAILIYCSDNLKANVFPNLTQASIWKGADGDMTVTKGGDEMINFIFSLDIYAECDSKSGLINTYIDHQERNGIPTTLERIPEE